MGARLWIWLCAKFIGRCAYCQQCDAPLTEGAVDGCCDTACRQEFDSFMAI